MITERILIGFINGIPKIEGGLKHVESKPVDYDSELKWVKTSHVFSEDWGGIEVYWKCTIEEFPTYTIPGIGENIVLNKVNKKITITYD